MPNALVTFPASRPDGYDADVVWTPDAWAGNVYTEPEWSTVAGVYVPSGGGRWMEHIVLIGHNLIYYTE